MLLADNHYDQERKLKKGYKLIAKKLAYNITENTNGARDKEECMRRIEKEVEKFFYFKPSIQKFSLQNNSTYNNAYNDGMQEEYTSDGVYDSPHQPKRPKFQLCSDPEEAQDINPQVVYSIIDDEENTTMIQGRIFEVKKNIMSKASFGGSGDNEGTIAPGLEHIRNNLYFKLEDRYYTKMKIVMERLNREHQIYLKTRGQLCLHCLSYHVGDCDKKTCFKCGRLGHLVSQCPFKYDKLTCFKCGKKGHKIYDCQIVIISSNPMNSFSVDREPISVESQKRGWMKEELKRAKCVQCSTSGHLFCTNDHFTDCADDKIYKGQGFFGTMQNHVHNNQDGSMHVNQGIMGGYNGLGGLFGGGGYDYYGKFNSGGNMNSGRDQQNLSLSARLNHRESYRNSAGPRPMVERMRVQNAPQVSSAGRPMTQFESSFAKFTQLGDVEQLKKRAINAFFEADAQMEKKRKIVSSESPEREDQNNQGYQQGQHPVLDMPQI